MAYKPTTAYKGSLPTGTVRKGNKGKDVKAVQTFLNWCMGLKLATDGVCGSSTVSAIKKWQKRYSEAYGLAPDGVFGAQSRSVAKKLIKKYAPKKTTTTKTTSATTTTAPAPSTTTTTTKVVAKPKTPQDKMLAWAKKIAADDSYHYVFYSSGKKAHECPICHKHAKGKFHGWNCIGYAWGSWHHGAGLKTKCSCDVINNAQYEKMLHASKEIALKMAQSCVKTKNIKLLRSKSGIALSRLKPGDIIAYFNGNRYVHTAIYIGNGKIADCTSGRKDQIKYGAKSYKSMTIKLAFRYTGK